MEVDNEFNIFSNDKNMSRVEEVKDYSSYHSRNHLNLLKQTNFECNDQNEYLVSFESPYCNKRIIAYSRTKNCQHIEGLEEQNLINFILINKCCPICNCKSTLEDIRIDFLFTCVGKVLRKKSIIKFNIINKKWASLEEEIIEENYEEPIISEERKDSIEQIQKEDSLTINVKPEEILKKPEDPSHIVDNFLKPPEEEGALKLEDQAELIEEIEGELRFD